MEVLVIKTSNYFSCHNIIMPHIEFYMEILIQIHLNFCWQYTIWNSLVHCKKCVNEAGFPSKVSTYLEKE